MAALPVPIVPLLPLAGGEVLHEQIHSILKQNLMSGRFRPGQKLVLRDLAASLGTSLIPVRDALQRLESMGCVVSTPNRTMMVPELSAKQLRDIATLRIALETVTVERAAVERSEEETATLRGHLEDIRRSAQENDLDLFLEANFHFHMMIAQMSRLSFIAQLLEPLWLHMGPVIRQTVPDEQLFRGVVTHHQDAYDAIVARDPEAARSAIRMDILHGYPYGQEMAAG